MTEDNNLSCLYRKKNIYCVKNLNVENSIKEAIYTLIALSFYTF